MRFSKAFLIVFSIVLPVLVGAQHVETYSPIKAQNPIPKEFLTLSSDKYEEAKEHLVSSKELKNTKQDFLLESNFLIDQVLSSGRVLFNDTFSDYLNKVLDVILVNDLELRKQIRVYAVRSTVVNSFTTDDGIILVNLGLLAQLENEAQLAFILCHELVHFTEKHVIHAYVENQEIKHGKGEYKRSTFDERMLARSRYSKDLEKEADHIGLERFLTTPYGTSTILNVFEVMRYAHLPFDDIPFDKSFFNEGYYHVDDSYFLDRVRPVNSNGNGTTEHTTHPAPSERQQLISGYLSRTDTTSKANYIVSEPEFKKLRELARFELSDLYLNTNQPIKSIYNTFLLQQKHPENNYLKKSIAHALYTLSKFKSGGNFGYVHPGYRHIEGESQQVFHLFYRLEPKELCILATGHLWRLKDQYPNDKDIELMSKDLLNDLMKNYYVPGMFVQTKPMAGWDTPDTTSAVKGKYDRLKQKSKVNPQFAMVKHALADLFENATFTHEFEELERKIWGNTEYHTEKEVRKKTKVDLRHWKNHGFALGAEKVVVVSPTYSKLDLRKRRKHKFLRSESAKHKLIDRIEHSANLLNLDVQVLESSLLDSNQVDVFNDIAFLNEWVDLRFLQLDVAMVNLNHDRIDSIIRKYDTELFTWTGVINYRENKPLLYFYLLYALIPPAIPLAVYYLVRPNYDTYYYCITFNLRTGEPVMVNYHNYRRQDARDLINSSVYDSLWQMKQKSKKKG